MIKAQEAHVRSLAFSKKINSLINGTVDLIDVDELKADFEDYYIIDTRRKEEYDLSHLSGVHLINYKAADAELDDIHTKKPIVVYCSIGVRSEKLGERLKQRGFEVYNLYGGIFEWVNRGNSVYTCDKSGEQQLSQTIHQYNPLWGKWMTNTAYEKKGMILF